MTTTPLLPCCRRVLADIASPDGTRCWCGTCGAEWLRVGGKGWKLVQAPHKRICAWCGLVLAEGREPISHGICKDCKREMENGGDLDD